MFIKYWLIVKIVKMVKNKSKVMRKVGKAVATAGLCLLPLLSSGQSSTSIQRGVNAGTFVRETPLHMVYRFGFNEDLKKAIKKSKEPHLYTTDPNSYIRFNNDTSAFELFYSKKNFNEKGEGKSIGLTIREKGKVGVCDPKGLGSRGSVLPSFYWVPSHAYLEEKVETEKPREVVKEQPSNNYNITNINNTTNTNYNYYGDTTKNKLEKTRGEGLELRLLIEGNKTINPLESPFFGGSAAIQLGKGAVWLGPYATAGFGKETNFSSTPVYNETLLNQALQLSTITEGVRNEYAEKAYPIEFGGLLSVGSKDGRVRVNLGYGVVKEAVSTSDVVETGYDWMSQNGAVVGEKKPYAINIEKGVDSDKYIPTQKVGVDVHPFKNSGFYLGAEAQHIGKVDSKMDRINYNVKAGWRFGGKRK